MTTTITEDFAGAFNSGLWTKIRAAGPSGTLTQTGGQLETDAGAGSEQVGLISNIKYDLTAPGSVEVDCVLSDADCSVYISTDVLTDDNDANEFTVTSGNWYRGGTLDAKDFWFFQKRVGGGSATLIDLQSTPTPGTLFKIKFEAADDDIRLIQGGSTELASDATYALASKSVYCGFNQGSQAGQLDADFDDFEIVYTGAVPIGTLQMLGLGR